MRSLLGKYRNLPGVVWTLLSVQFLMNASHFMVMPLLALHLTNRLGAGAAELGTVLSIHLFSARLLPAITGPLADLYGSKKLMVSGLALRASGLLGFAVLTNPVGLSAAALVMGAGTAAYESAVYGAFARYPVETATRIFVLNNQALNLGVIVGPMIGGGLLLVGSEHVFLVSALAFAVLGAWLVTLDRVDEGKRSGVAVSTSVKSVVTNKPFLSFFLTTLPWWFLFSQLYVVFPIYAVRLSGSETGASLVFLVNGVAGSIFVLVSILAFEKLRADTVLVMCYGGLGIAYLVVPAFSGVGWFLAFICIYTLAETLILPAIKSMIATLATRGNEATFQGFENLGWAAAGGLGNYVGGWLILEASPSMPWLVFSIAASVGLATSLWFRTTHYRTQAKFG